jgi:hypothetical protein
MLVIKRKWQGKQSEKLEYDGKYQEKERSKSESEKYGKYFFI